MKKETTLLDRLILQEMTSSRVAGKGRKLIKEAGEDPMAGAGAPAGGADPMAGGDPMGGAPAGGADPMGGAGAPPAGGADPMAGGADPMGGAGAPPAGGADPMGGAPAGGADPMGGDPMGGADPMGGDPMGGDPMGGDDPMGGGDDEDDAETLNIDDLTNSQEKMNNKINAIGKNQIKTDSRIENLLNAVEKLKSTIDDNNAEIQRLQKDIIKRNPTPTEDLYLQSLASYPYNTNISDYWKSYADNKRDNYNIIAGGMASRPDGGQDIDGSNADDEQVYEITADDLDDFSADDVYDSFSIGNDDDEEGHNAFRPRF